jgi:multisubunit Na+/H+ antiporter MnhB subunit
LPDRGHLIRGLALALLAAVFGHLARLTAQRSFWLWPAAAFVAVIGVLAAWAALIHLTGGERFDDHRLL